MNRDMIAGKWTEIRGQVKQWWGKLTDDDIDRVEGSMERLAGVLQQRYGWEREQAEREIKSRLEWYDAESRACIRASVVRSTSRTTRWKPCE